MNGLGGVLRRAMRGRLAGMVGVKMRAKGQAWAMGHGSQGWAGSWQTRERRTAPKAPRQRMARRAGSMARGDAREMETRNR